MKKDLISVIVPIFNGEKYISSCLSSICSITNIDIEVIIIDDGSQDQTREVCIQFVDRDCRVKYFYERNQGVSTARNYGLDCANGEYIVFVDGDDEIIPSNLTTLYHEIKNSKSVDLVISGLEIHYSSYIDYLFPPNICRDAQSIIEEYGKSYNSVIINGPCSKLYKHSIIKQNNLKFDSALELGEDTVFVFNYLKYCKNIKMINEIGYIYNRKSNTSLMTKFIINRYNKCQIVYQRLRLIAQEICLGEVPDSLNYAYYHVLLNCLFELSANSTFHKNEQLKRNIREYMNDDIVYNYLKSIKNKTFQEVALIKLINQHHYWILEKLLLIKTRKWRKE